MDSSQQIDSPTNNIVTNEVKKHNLLFKIILSYYVLIKPISAVYILFLYIFGSPQPATEGGFYFIAFGIIGSIVGVFLGWLAYNFNKYGLYGLFIFPYTYLLGLILLGRETNIISVIVSSTIINVLIILSIFKKWKYYNQSTP